LSDSDELDEFLRMDGAALRAELAAGSDIDIASLENSVYFGISLGMPGWIDRLAWKTFAKAFWRDTGSDGLRGWNIRLEQNGVEGPRVPIEKRGAPLTFGHFAVRQTRDYRLPRPSGGNVLLDYSLGGNPRMDPTAFIRDPLVRLEGRGRDWLLGWTYVDLGVLRLPTPSFFLLERHEDLAEPAPAPRG